MAKHVLFDAQTSNATSSIVTVRPGVKTVGVGGTFDSATVQAQGSLDGINWADLPNGDFTQNKIMNLKSHGSMQFRYTLSSAGASTSITAIIDGAQAVSGNALSDIFSNCLSDVMIDCIDLSSVDSEHNLQFEDNQNALFEDAQNIQVEH